MVLLFNKIYIKSDQVFKASRSRIVMSKNFGHLWPSDPHFAHTSAKVEPIPAMMQAASYDQLIDIAFDGDQNKFFQFLVEYDSNSRLTIYCDADATFKLVLKFWKTLYPRMSADAFYLLLNFTFSYFIEMLGNKYAIFTKLDQTQADTVRTEYTSYLADENKQHILAQWSEITPWKITRTQREEIVKNASVELQLASMMSNPKWRYSNNLQTKVVKMIKKEMIHEFSHDIRYGILLNLVNFKAWEPTTTFDIFANTLDELVAQHPQYRFIIDSTFVPDRVDYIFANYDMSILKTIRQKLVSSDPAIDVDWSSLMKNDLTFDDIIAFELSTPTNKLFLSRGDYHESVNPYIINYIFNSMRNNTVSLLSEFELV